MKQGRVVRFRLHLEVDQPQVLLQCEHLREVNRLPQRIGEEVRICDHHRPAAVSRRAALDRLVPRRDESPFAGSAHDISLTLQLHHHFVHRSPADVELLRQRRLRRQPHIAVTAPDLIEQARFEFVVPGIFVFENRTLYTHFEKSFYIV